MGAVNGERHSLAGANVGDIIEGLLLFDEPMLNRHYHAILRRDQNPERRQLLATLPGMVLRSHQLSRDAAKVWQNVGRGTLDQSFIEKGEHVVLEAYLGLAENELRLIAFMARSAPTNDARAPFDEMAENHREIAEVLRKALRDLTSGTPPAPQHPLRSVQEENAEGDLRGQVEAAIRARRESGRGVRRVVLSHTAQRRLRDQGCFQGEDTTLLGAPVAIDLSWESPAFAIEGYDVVPLEEILAQKP